MELVFLALSGKKGSPRLHSIQARDLTARRGSRSAWLLVVLRSHSLSVSPSLTLKFPI